MLPAQSKLRHSELVGFNSGVHQAFAGGSSASGVLISMLRILTKLIFGEDRDGLRQSTILYFTIGAAITLACAVLSLYVIPNLPIVRYYNTAAGASTGLCILPFFLSHLVQCHFCQLVN